MRIGKRRISKRLVFILVPMVLVLGGTGAALAAEGLPFTDIAGTTHEQSIVNMANRGITTGYPDGTFRPDNPVTRGQMMTFLDRYTSGNGCTDCHDDTSKIVTKDKEISSTLKSEGVSYLRATSKDCSGCHGSDLAKDRIDANLDPHDASIVGNPEPDPINCRTCHGIHTSYTGADWTLTGGEAPVVLEYTGGTFDKGAANLCVNCHQNRTAAPTASNGQVEVTSSRYGPHHGVQGSMLLGEGGMLVANATSIHYQSLQEACVSCHMGDGRNHDFTPVVSRCQSCHPGATDFDMNGFTTEVSEKLETLKAGLIAKGIMDAQTELAIPGTYAEQLAAAMWNYVMLTEDKCNGVHNPAYTTALLDQALAAVQ